MMMPTLKVGGEVSRDKTGYLYLTLTNLCPFMKSTLRADAMIKARDVIVSLDPTTKKVRAMVIKPTAVEDLSKRLAESLANDFSYRLSTTLNPEFPPTAIRWWFNHPEEEELEIDGFDLHSVAAEDTP